MTRQEMLEIVRHELAVATAEDVSDADEAADLRHDLGIDSLSILEWVARLEYRFDLAVPDESWPQLTSISTVVDYLTDALVSS